VDIISSASALLLLTLALFSAAATINAIRPFRNTVLLLPSMLWSWFVLGMLGQTLAVQIVLAGLLIWAGALTLPVGWVALAILLASWIGTSFVIARTRGAGAAVDAALADAGIVRTTHRVPTWRKLLAFPLRGRSVVKQRGIVFRRAGGWTMRLDVYTDGSNTDMRPVLMYIHGGAWIIGDKREQGLPMMHHLARNGWVCFTVNYRLSPIARWPDQLVDVKGALAWIREHAAEYGGDPSFIAVAGGSAGGHLATLVSLTENQPNYQKGFEDADTSVQAAVAIYAITDVTNRLGVQSRHFVPRLMEPLVIQAYLEDEPEKFQAASPIDQVHPDAPPFAIVQGDSDTMAPVEEARAFVDRLRDTSEERAVYMEFPGAQHIFDLGYSYQCAEMIEGVLSVLEDEYRQHRHRRQADGTAAQEMGRP
jgi:acetyl esterase/lipase